MAKPKMSAEEAAVRKALAVVEADTGLAKAQEIIKTGAVPAATATAKPTYEESRNLVSQVTNPILREALEKAYAGADASTERLKTQYETLGYIYDPNTGIATPKSSISGDNASAKKDSDIDKNTRNAFAILKQVFTQYNLGDLSSVIETLMKEGYEPEEATLALKTDPRYNKAYITRFRGNELRRSAGLNVLDEATYLTLENDYMETLKSYGLESYFGVEKSIKQSAIADVIGADISAVEFTERVSTAVDRVDRKSVV